MIGGRLQIITAAKVTEGNKNDSPFRAGTTRFGTFCYPYEQKKLAEAAVRRRSPGE